MIITVLTQKYRCGCNKGISKEETPELLEKLNKVIQWDKVTWPEKEEGVPNTEYLGLLPQLKPGDTFLWDENVMAIDDERSIVLIVSETGPLSVRRFVESLNNDFDLVTFNSEGVELEEDALWQDPEENFEEFRTKYSKYKCIKDRCDDPNFLKKRKIKIKNIPLPVILPTVVYVDGQKIFYNPEEVDPDIIEKVSNVVYYWITQNKKEKGN